MTIKVAQIFREGNKISDYFANIVVDNECTEFYMSFTDLPREVKGML